MPPYSMYLRYNICANGHCLWFSMHLRLIYALRSSGDANANLSVELVTSPSHAIIPAS